MSGIPKFRSEKEEAEFWDTHEFIDYLKETEPARLKFPKPKKKLVSIRLEETQIKTLKEIAAKKGIGYLTLSRMWLMERLAKEAKR